MHQRDVARQQVGQLGKEQRRAQIRQQPLVQQRAGVGGVAHGGEDRLVGGVVALAAAGRDDHVHALEQVGVALDPGGVQREAGGVHADALPGLHLPLVAALGDLLVQVERTIGCTGHGAKRAVSTTGWKPAGRVQRCPVGVGAFAQAGNQADAGDQCVAVRHALGNPSGR